MTPATRDELIRILEELSLRDTTTASDERLFDAVSEMLAEGYAAASETDTNPPLLTDVMEWIEEN